MSWYAIFKSLFTRVFGTNQDLDLSGLHAVYARVSSSSPIPMRWHILTESSLVKEASIEAKKGGERGITARSVKKVTAVSNPTLVCKALADLVFSRIHWPSSKDE